MNLFINPLLQIYDDLLALKRKPVLLIDSENIVQEIVVQAEILPVVRVEIPVGFFTFGYVAMKYLVVKAYKGQ